MSGKQYIVFIRTGHMKNVLTKTTGIQQPSSWRKVDLIFVLSAENEPNLIKGLIILRKTGGYLSPLFFD